MSSAPIPTSEPQRVRAGDTVAWTRSSSDFPPPDWTLHYAISGASGRLAVLDSTPSEGNHLISVSATDSAKWLAGEYTWVAYVSNVGGERYTLDHGNLTVLPDLAAEAAAGGIDARSHNRKMLDAITAVLEGKATADVHMYKIGERELTKLGIEELETWFQKYAWRVAREEGTAPRFLGARFTDRNRYQSGGGAPPFFSDGSPAK